MAQKLHIHNFTQYTAKSMCKYIFGDHYADLVEELEKREWHVILYRPEEEEHQKKLEKDVIHFVKHWGPHYVFDWTKRPNNGK